MVRAWRAAWLAGDLTAHQSRWFEPAGAEQLYDIQQDPHELINLVASPAHQQILAELRTQLENFLASGGRHRRYR